MTERAGTDRPRGLLQWAKHVVEILIVGGATVFLGALLWWLHMRQVSATVERASCAEVVFESSGRRWRYEPDGEECRAFVVGARWLIQVNDAGAVRPRRKE